MINEGRSSCPVEATHYHTRMMLLASEEDEGGAGKACKGPHDSASGRSTWGFIKVPFGKANEETFSPLLSKFAWNQ